MRNGGGPRRLVFSLAGWLAGWPATGVQGGFLNIRTEIRGKFGCILKQKGEKKVFFFFWARPQ
jgi:hypothetical protein